jgi:hypothetical protein
VGAFDWLKRKQPTPLVWRVYRDGSDLVVDDSRGNSSRVPLSHATAVRVVPLSSGSHHGVGLGYQVAIVFASGDAAVGKPILDWRDARGLADEVCRVVELPLDELTQKLFSRVGSFTLKSDS